MKLLFSAPGGSEWILIIMLLVLLLIFPFTTVYYYSKNRRLKRELKILGDERERLLKKILEK